MTENHNRGGGGGDKNIVGRGGGGLGSPLSPHCVGSAWRAKLNSPCMESCKGIAELDLPGVSLEGTKVYDGV